VVHKCKQTLLTRKGPGAKAISHMAIATAPAPSKLLTSGAPGSGSLDYGTHKRECG